MPNHLINENSPYLLQHVDNPVDWYPWGDEALDKAKREDKPIFLSIGYAACHWCHVMAHESFENDETAAILNQHFVSIKVDREERPDLDGIYMQAVIAVTGQGGWPLSVFLTSEGIPFYGGTYFPPRPRYGMPSFKELLASIARAWVDDREKLLQSGQEILQNLHRGNPGGLPQTELNAATLDQAALRLSQTYDWKFGGWGKAPKFPQPMAVEFLLRRASRGDRFALEIAEHLLTAMSQGGMYDLVGGGFARYSTDNTWLTPHFEKMLYDNAQLARVYLQGYLLTSKEHYRRICVQTLDFIARELMLRFTRAERSYCAFFSSLDADSEGEEGKFYTWSLEEIRQTLLDANDYQPGDEQFFIETHAITSSGNFEGKTILQLKTDVVTIAENYECDPADIIIRLDRLYQTLFRRRSDRVRPTTDDKALTAWNSLTLIAFSEAARYLQRSDYLGIARANAEFLLSELNRSGFLLRSWRKGTARHTAYLEDYAGLILGLLSLYQSDPDVKWYTAARYLANDMLANYQDPDYGFFDVRQDQTDLIIRPKDIQDNATPSGNALACLALLQLSLYSGQGEFRDRTADMLARVSPFAERYPTAFAQWLIAADFANASVLEVAILGDRMDEKRKALEDALWSEFRPDLVAAISDYPPPDAPELLANRPLKNGRATAYVCQNFTCLRPVNSPAELLSQLSQSRHNVTGQ